MFADVELVTGTRKLPAVPKAAIVTRDGKPHAFFVVDGRLEERILSLGPDSDGASSVTHGAAVGDKVATGDVKSLANGQRVR